MKIIVIGAGIIGSSIALELASRQHDVVLIDPKGIGEEASSAAAGMLASQSENHDSKAFSELCMTSARLYPKWIKDLESLTHISTECFFAGSLKISSQPQTCAALSETVRKHKANDLSAEYLDTTELHQRFPQLNSNIIGGAYFPHEGQVDPRRLMQALKAALQLRQVNVYQDRVLDVSGSSRQTLQVFTEKKVILEGDHVVLTAGSWSSAVRINGAPSPIAVKPIRGQMLELKCTEYWSGTFFVKDGLYVVPRRDSSVVVGSTLEDVGFNVNTESAAIDDLYQRATELLPCLKNALITRSWAGLRPKASGEHPIIQPGPLPGLWFATGHYRNGILLAPVTTKLIVEAICDRTAVI